MYLDFCMLHSIRHVLHSVTGKYSVPLIPSLIIADNFSRQDIPVIDGNVENYVKRRANFVCENCLKLTPSVTIFFHIPTFTVSSLIFVNSSKTFRVTNVANNIKRSVLCCDLSTNNNIYRTKIMRYFCNCQRTSKV